MDYIVGKKYLWGDVEVVALHDKGNKVFIKVTDDNYPNEKDDKHNIYWNELKPLPPITPPEPPQPPPKPPGPIRQQELPFEAMRSFRAFIEADTGRATFS